MIVRLQEYYNAYNLQYKPEGSTTPYCRCGNKSACFTSTDADNLTLASCPFQCSLRFIICDELVNVTMPDFERCFQSEVNSAPPLVDFAPPSSSNDFFPNQETYPQFIFRYVTYSQTVSRQIRCIYLVLLTLFHVFLSRQCTYMYLKWTYI